MSEDRAKTIRTMGVIKIVAGLVMLPFFPVLIFLGFLIKIMGGLGLLAGGATKIASIYAADNAKKEFWAERTEKLISFGTMGFISGFILTIPFLPGVIVMFEGIYNAVAVEDSCGIIPALKFAGKFMSDLVSGICKKDKIAEPAKILKQKAVEEKPLKNVAKKEASSVKKSAVKAKPTAIKKAATEKKPALKKKPVTEKKTALKKKPVAKKKPATKK